MCLQFVINSVDTYLMTTTACLLKFSWDKFTFFPGADTFLLEHVHFMLVTLHGRKCKTRRKIFKTKTALESSLLLIPII